MKVAFNHQIFSIQKYGGVSRYIVKLADQLDAKGQEVKIFAPFHKNYYLENLPQKLVRGGYLARFNRHFGRVSRFANAAITKRQLANWQPDIVHQTYYDRYMKKRRRAPTVITVHDMIHELYPDDFRRRDKTSRVKKANVETADHVICVSQNTRRDLIELLNVPSNKVSVCHHGIEVLAAPNIEIDATSPLQPYILFVGGRRGYKNFHGLLEAVALSPQLKMDFCIVAFGGSSFSATERQQILDLGFSQDQVVQITGGDALLGSYYQNASAFVYPSHYEGFGLPPLEAMARDCPVVSSNTSSMPEVIGEAAEFFDPTSVDDMSRAIQNVVYSTEMQNKLILKGQKRVKLFTWEKCADQTLAIYDKLI